jgi:hypothetical protein
MDKILFALWIVMVMSSLFIGLQAAGALGIVSKLIKAVTDAIKRVFFPLHQ